MRRRNRLALAMLAPAALVLALFFIGPAVWAIYAGLTDRSLSPDTRFIGFDNYLFIWNNPDFLKFVRNTVVFVLGSAIVGQTLGGLALALLIDQSIRRGHHLSQLAYAAVLVAWIAPPVFAGGVWGEIFAFRGGYLNRALTALGLERIDMLGDHAMLAVVIADSWRGVGLAMLIYLAALRRLPVDIYEAAHLDGATTWRRFTDQTLPLLKPAIGIVAIVTTLATVGGFLLILILTNGDPAYQTETLALFAYHRAFGQFEIGYGAAISVLMLALNLAFAAVYLRLVRSDEP